MEMLGAAKTGGAKVLAFTREKQAEVLGRRDALVEAHLPLVKIIAAQIKRTLPPSFDLDDLVGAGHMGLIEAATRYRPSEHGDVPFEAFARPRIRGAILDSLRRDNYTNSTHCGLDQVAEPAVSNVIETTIENGRLTRKLKDATETLPPRERKLIELHYSKDVTLAKIAEEMDVHPSRVSQLHAQALKALREKLAA